MTATVSTPATIAVPVDNHRRFLAFLEQRVGTRQEAEEILQAAFVRGLERAGEIRDDERAVAWFFRLLRNALVDHWRSRAAESRGREALARELAGHTASEPGWLLSPMLAAAAMSLSSVSVIANALRLRFAGI